MTENRALVVRELTPSVWDMISKIAPAVHQSRLFGVLSAEQAAGIMLKGHELGFGLTTSFEFVHPIQGKLSLSPKGSLALIFQSPYLAGLRIEDHPDRCTVWMKRTNGVEYQTSFTMEQAKKAGLIKSGSAWESYGPNMLRWRAIGFCADIVFPDVIGGMKRADEYGAAIDSTGSVIEGSWSEVPTPAVAAPSPVSLSDLVNQFGAQMVMDVNGGQIPATDAEVAEVASRLMVTPTPEDTPKNASDAELYPYEVPS